jgi:hypothetical protein
MKKKNNGSALFGLEGWLDAAQFSNEQQRRGSTPERSQFLHAVWPMCEEHFSPIRQTFLMNHLDLTSLDESPLWLIRDGLVPILWFRIFPSPQKLKTRLLVHADLTSAVPEAWRGSVGTYKIVSLPGSGSPRTRPARFLVAGPFGESICDPETFSAKLAALKSKFGAEKLGSAGAAVFLPARPSIHRTMVSDVYHTVCLQKIFEAFGGVNGRVTPIDWNRMRWSDEFIGDLVEFNDRLLWADNFLVHHVLSSGGRIAGEAPLRAAGSGEDIVELSPNHGYLVNLRLRASASRGRADLEAHRRAINGPANRSYPWYDWMSRPRG